MQTCLICNQPSWKKEFQVQDIFDEQYNFGSCNSCQVYSLNPFPNKRQLDQAYDESYHGFGEKKFNPLVEKVLDWFRKQNAKQFAKELPEKAKVLDVGCGNGTFLEYLGKQGDFELHGIEPIGKSGDRAEKLEGLKVRRGFLEENTFEKLYFDAIILTHVFEHLPNPLKSLKTISAIAADNAILQIEIPNVNSIQYKLFKAKWLHLDPPRHLNMFPPKVLKEELNKLGWELTSERDFSPQFSPYGLQQSLLNLLLKRREVLYEYLKGNKSYTKDYSQLSLGLQKAFHWITFPFFVSTDLIASVFKKGGTVKLRFRKK